MSGPRLGVLSNNRGSGVTCHERYYKSTRYILNLYPHIRQLIVPIDEMHNTFECNFWLNYYLLKYCFTILFIIGNIWRSQNSSNVIIDRPKKTAYGSAFIVASHSQGFFSSLYIYHTWFSFLALQTDVARLADHPVIAAVTLVTLDVSAWVTWPIRKSSNFGTCY